MKIKFNISIVKLLIVIRDWRCNKLKNYFEYYVSVNKATNAGTISEEEAEFFRKKVRKTNRYNLPPPKE